MPNRQNKLSKPKKPIYKKKKIIETPTTVNDLKREITVIKSQLRIFSGPLPDPEAFSKYDQILPGTADRIILMAEKQQKHRREIEKKIVKSNTINEKLGLIFGFMVALAAIGGGVYCAHIKQLFGTLILGGGGLVSLVSAFIYGSRAIRREKEE